MVVDELLEGSRVGVEHDSGLGVSAPATVRRPAAMRIGDSLNRQPERSDDVRTGDRWHFQCAPDGARLRGVMRRRVRHSRLIGREGEVKRVQAALADCAEVPGILIAGEAGIGKSRLVAEVVGRAARDGATVVTGGCMRPCGEDLPLVPFIEVVGRLADRLGVRSSDVAGRDTGDLAGLLPPRGPAPAVPRIRQFEAVRNLLEAAGHPLVVVIEDLQWIDPSSLDLLVYLLRKARGGRLAVVMTLRPEDLDRASPGALALAEMQAAGRLARIDLLPLGQTEVELLVAAFDPRASPATRQVALERGDGNPLLIRELVAAQCETTEAIPATVRDLLLLRVQLLSAAARAVLAAAAVIGRAFNPVLLHEMGVEPPAPAATGLREALDRQLLVAVPGTDDVALRHALLIEVLTGGLSPTEQRDLHARIAAVLERRPDLSLPTPAAAASEVAAHWTAASAPDRALTAAVRAARLLARLPAPVEAHRLFERAIGLWDAVTEPERTAGATRAVILDEAGEVAFQAGAVERSVWLGREAIAACPDGDAAAIGRLEACLAKRLGWACDIDAMAVVAERAVAHTSRASDPGSQALALAALASAAMHRGRFREAERLAGVAADLVGAADDSSTHAWALAIRAECLGQMGDDAAGLALADRAVEIADRGGDSWSWWVAHGNRRDLLWVLGWHPEQAEAAVAAGRSAASRLHLGGAFAVDWRWGELNLWYGLGRWDDVEAAATALIDEVASVGTSTPVRAWARALRGTVRVLRGDVEAGEQDLLAGLEARAPVSEGMLARPRRGLAESALLHGEPARALDLIDAEFAEFAGADGVLDAGHLAVLGIRAAADLAVGRRARRDGDGSAAAVLRGDAYAATLAGLRRRPDGTTLPSTGLAAYAAWGEAESSRLHGRHDPDRWAVAAVALGRWSRPWAIAYARYREAEASLAVPGGRDRAARALEAASARAAALGAQPLLAAIADLSRRGRLAVPAAAPAAGMPAAATAALSRRERQVLERLIQGCTNREIGEQLFITEATASVHVSHILDKLGVDSRGAAVALAVRSDGAIRRSAAGRDG